MDDDFLNNFFKDLTDEIGNEEYVNALKEHVDDMDGEKLEKLIKEHF